MIEFIKRIFGFQPATSGATAKERLRLVLLSDHLSLAPEVIDALKRDLLGVISRYVEIDESQADVTFEHRDREIAMLASVPIRSVLSRQLPPPSQTAPPAPSNGKPVLAVPPLAEVPPPAEALSAAPPASEEAQEPIPEEQPAELAPVSAALAKPATNSARRRRRRKKAASGPQPLQMRAAHL
jgi:cell division topological specificity factor